VRDVLVTHRAPLAPELIYRRRHVQRVPGDDGVGEEVQASRLVRLGILLLPADLPLVGEEEELAKRMEGLALVELPVDPPAVLLALEVVKDEDRLLEPAVAPGAPG